MPQIILEIEHLNEELEKFAEKHLHDQPYALIKNIINNLKACIVSRDLKVVESAPIVPALETTITQDIIVPSSEIVA